MLPVGRGDIRRVAAPGVSARRPDELNRLFAVERRITLELEHLGVGDFAAGREQQRLAHQGRTSFLGPERAERGFVERLFGRAADQVGEFVGRGRIEELENRGDFALSLLASIRTTAGNV